MLPVQSTALDESTVADMTDPRGELGDADYGLGAIDFAGNAALCP